MTVIAVRKITYADVNTLAGVLARAFQVDPMTRHLLPDPTQRLRGMELAFQLFLRQLYLSPQESYTNAGRQGGALWLPPGHYPPSLRHQVLMLPGFIRIFGRRTPTAFRDVGVMEKMHPTDVPHWYLGFLGVEPAEQGKGHGSALLQPVLQRCDAEAVPAYLETSNERNLPLYVRHGFKVIRECDIPRGPHFWGMWREPQAVRPTAVA